jgi:hypothetical protein
MTTKPHRPHAVCSVRCDERGITIQLPKSSSVALTRCRDVCAALAAAAPTVAAQAGGIRKALDSLIAALNSGPKAVEAEPLEDEDDVERPY